MTYYFVTVTSSFLVPVKAESIDEARGVVAQFCDTKEEDFTDTVLQNEYDITDIEEVDPIIYDCRVGLSAEHPNNLSPIEGE